MTWPIGPPPMPPSGWYDDPETPWTWRYWDGMRWTGNRSPMWVTPARDPTSLSAWFERSVTAVKVAARHVGLLLAGLWVALGACAAVFVIMAFGSERGRELRDLLGLDQSRFGPTGSSSTVELTTAEADRAWELVRGLFVSAIPWMALLGVALVGMSVWSVALVAQVVHMPVADPIAEPARFVAVGRRALARTPAVLASTIVVFGLLTSVWLIAMLPVALIALLGGGGAAIVLTVVFDVLLASVASAWLWGRLALASVIAASGGFGIGVRRSWALTHGQFWFVVGRLLIVGLIGVALGGAANVFNVFGQFLGFGVQVAVLLLFQAVTTAATTILTVCGQLVTADQADARVRSAATTVPR